MLTFVFFGSLGSGTVLTHAAEGLWSVEANALRPLFPVTSDLTMYPCRDPGTHLGLDNEAWAYDYENEVGEENREQNHSELAPRQSIPRPAHVCTGESCADIGARLRLGVTPRKSRGQLSPQNPGSVRTPVSLPGCAEL